MEVSFDWSSWRESVLRIGHGVGRGREDQNAEPYERVLDFEGFLRHHNVRRLRWKIWRWGYRREAQSPTSVEPGACSDHRTAEPVSPILHTSGSWQISNAMPWRQSWPLHSICCCCHQNIMKRKIPLTSFFLIQLFWIHLLLESISL